MYFDTTPNSFDGRRSWPDTSWMCDLGKDSAADSTLFYFPIAILKVVYYFKQKSRTF